MDQDIRLKKVFAANLKKYMKEHEVSQSEIAKVTGKSQQAVSSWLNSVRMPRMGVVETLANYFHIQKSDLLEEKEPDNTVSNSLLSISNIVPIQPKKLKVIGSIAAGSPIFAEEEYDVYVTPGEEVKCDYGLRVKGDSMIDDRINDGDLVFIKQQEMVENGQIAAVIIDDCATLKHFYYYPETDLVILKPANKNYEDMIFQGDQISNIRVLGKAVGFTSKL